MIAAWAGVPHAARAIAVVLATQPVAGVNDSSAMKAFEHVEEIILATTGTWSRSRSRLCRR